MNEIDEEFLRRVGQRIRDVRKLRKMSQEELAIRIGRTQNAISRYESGDSDIGITELRRIASALNFPIPYLTGDSWAEEGLEILDKVLSSSLAVAASIYLLRCLEFLYGVQTLIRSQGNTDRELDTYFGMMVDNDTLFAISREEAVKRLEHYYELQKAFYRKDLMRHLGTKTLLNPDALDRYVQRKREELRREIMYVHKFDKEDG